MAHPAYIRDKAVRLRMDRQLSIDEIADRLVLSRSTINYWVRDIPISRTGRGSGFSSAARQKAAESNSRRFRRLRESAYEDGEASFDEMSLKAGFREFVVLYIAEGYKRDRNMVSICNSDPAVVHFAARWVRDLTSHPVSFSFQFHADQDPAALQNFWASTLGVEAPCIRPQAKSNSGELSKRNWRCQHGVLMVRTSDTYLRARLQAWIDRVKAEWVN